MDPKSADDQIAVMAGDCIAVRLRTLNRAVTAIYDEELRPHGLRVGQLNLLVAIGRMKAARAVALCQLLQMDKSTLSRDIVVLKRNGWLEMDDAGGGRTRPIRLTRAGLDLISSAQPAWQAAQERVRELLGDDESSSIAGVADRLWFQGASPS